ncbi:Hypothetical protein SMAX5B_002558 [Scophthalmus maximus]|uniref:Uncharacterized protein n=1 Tax=Scophthalmus maximus TaxID=52904 RepID=A0A2U9AX18_SCOMX|nr:Hypothetical protein SMAX5B_002558 [Scophthalmus maximus]
MAESLWGMEVLAQSSKLPLDHYLSCRTLWQVVLMLGAWLWRCNSGAYLYRWERLTSNRNMA